MAKILVVEDDERIRGLLVEHLDGHGHEALGAADGTAALDELADTEFDLVVLDLGLPDVDGAEVLRRLREYSETPVIVATARDGESDIISALNAGADAYVLKPFGAAELEARIRAVLRRSGGGSSRVLRVGALAIDRAARVVTLDGADVDLNRKEFDLLSFLAIRSGEVVTRGELASEVWRQPLDGNDRTIDVHLSWLRRKLGETAAAPRYLHTVRGVGVRLDEPA